MKKFLSVVLSAILLTGICVPTINADENGNFSVVVSVEGLSLGQGLYVKPVEYGLKEINALLSEKGMGPYKKEEISAAEVLLAVTADKNLSCETTGSAGKDLYFSSVRDLDAGIIDIPDIIGENGGPSNRDNTGQNDEYLGQSDYGELSGWIISVNNEKLNTGASSYFLADEKHPNPYNNAYVLRWQFSLCGFGADLGLADEYSPPFFEGANKDRLYIEYARSKDEAAKAMALPVMEKLTATQAETDEAEKIFGGQTALKALETLDAVTENLSLPLSSGDVFPDEWTIFALARGKRSALNDFFESWYTNKVKTIKARAAECPLHNGALDASKSTENSKAILSLYAIGKDPSDIEGTNLFKPFEDFSWIKKQGINGVIFALISLNILKDGGKYEDIKKQCADYIFNNRLPNGGWALYGDAADADITAMALTALATIQKNPEIKEIDEKAFRCLSALQNPDGSFSSKGVPTAESTAQAVIACTAYNINPDTDNRFIKNGSSAIDALLSFYDSKERAFGHISGGEKDSAATVQCICALTAYERFITRKVPLFDMSDTNKLFSEKISFNAINLYNGCGAALLPAEKKAVAIAVSGIEEKTKIIFTDGGIEFLYSPEISEKTRLPSYAALVSASCPTSDFWDADNYNIIPDETPNYFSFGDVNSDGILNALDALKAYDMSREKSPLLSDGEILSLNVDADGAITSLDALAIVDAFVSGTEFAAVAKSEALAADN